LKTLKSKFKKEVLRKVKLGTPPLKVHQASRH